MRITLFGLAAIAIIGAIIVFVGPLFISTDDLRNTLFAQVESATGYRLRVSGPVQVSLIPSLDLVAEDVGLAQGGAGKLAEMVTAKTLGFGFSLSRHGQLTRSADRSGDRLPRGAATRARKPQSKQVGSALKTLPRQAPIETAR